MMNQEKDSDNSPRINFEDELEGIHKKPGIVSRAGRELGRSVVTVFRSTTPDAVKEVWRMARWETQNVRCWRTLIFLLLLVTGAFVSSYTFVFLRHEQDSDFEANVSPEFLPPRLFLQKSYFPNQFLCQYFQFELFAHRIEYAVLEGSGAVATATKNIARTVSGAAASTNSSFPNVTVPFFEITGYTARHEAYLNMVAYTPVVTESERAAWQAYAVDNMDWIEQSRMFLGGKPDDMGHASSTNMAVRPFIWQKDEVGQVGPAFPSPYLPIWQTTPPPAAPDSLVNYNMLSAEYVENIFRAILIIRGTV